MDVPDDFDPRSEVFENPNSKTFSSGLGAKIQNSVNGVSKLVKLQVLKVPKSMTMVELENLFSQCGNARVSTKRNHHNLDVFVEYSKMSEVESAIRRFHNHPPYNLKLVVVEGESKKRQELPVFNEPMALATLDQISQSADNAVGLNPTVPFLYKVFNNLPEPYHGALGRMFEQSMTLSDNRRVSGGRVYCVPPVENYKVRESLDKLKESVTEYQKDVRFARSKVRHYESGEEPALPENFRKGSCAVCGVLSNLYCNKCKEVYYCCPECQLKDWSQHKLECGKETRALGRNGLAATESDFKENVTKMSSLENGKNMDESFTHKNEGLRRPTEANMYLRPTNRKTFTKNYNQNRHQSDSKSNASDTSSGSKKTMTNENDPKADSHNRSSGFNTNSNNASTPLPTTPSSAPKAQPSNYNHQNYNQNRRQSDSKSNASDTSSGSKKTMTNENDPKADSYNRSSGFNTNSNNASKPLPTTPSSAPKAQPSNHSKAEATKMQSKTPVKKRIQAGMVKNVSLASGDSNTEYWVHLVDDVTALNDLANELNKRITVSSPGLKKAVVDEWCCKNYDCRAWTRARIVSAEPLQIIYADYGNSEPTTLDQLKVLPADLADLPAFAIHVNHPDGLTAADAVAGLPMRFLSEGDGGQWTVEKAHANEVSEQEEPSRPEDNAGNQSVIDQASLSPSIQASTTSTPTSSSTTPRTPYFKEGEVHVVVLQDMIDETEYYVTRLDLKEDLNKLQSELNSEISDSSQQLQNIDVKSKCAAKFDGEWYRASVLKLEPLTVLYIDYGNQAICKPADIKELPPRFKTGLLTVRVRLSCAPSKEQFEALASGPVKLRVTKKEGSSWLADFATAEQSSSNAELAEQSSMSSNGPGSIAREAPNVRPEPNPDLSLLSNQFAEDSRLDKFKKITDISKENDTAYCEATRVLSHKLFTCRMASDSAQDDVRQIFKLDLGEPLDEPYRPELNEMVAVYWGQIDPSWRRGVVMSEMNDSYNVALVDLGLFVVSSKLKKLPDDYKTIPLISVKLSLDSSPPFHIRPGEVFRVTLQKNLADVQEWEIDVYSTGNEPFHLGGGRLSSWKIEPDQVPQLATQKLDSGNAVHITSFHDIDTIYVRPFNKQLMDLYNCLPQEVAAECIKADPLDRDPFLGELVAANWDLDGNNYRAQILGKSKKKGYYKVLFVDFGNTDDIHISKMKPISNILKSVPCFAIKVGLGAVESRTLTPAAYEYGIKLAENLDLLSIEFEILEEVQLTKLSDTTDINKKICELLEPSWMREPHYNTSLALQKYPMRQDLPEPSRENKFQIGKTEKVLVSYVPKFEAIRNGRIQLIVCKRSEELLIMYTKVLCNQMKEYIASQQKGEHTNRYVPHKGELCVCLAEGGTPMRAECVKVIDSNSARLAYVDYGDEEEANFNQIYKMTSDLMQLPAYATYCYAEGFPANTTYEKVLSAKSELDFCEAEIKSFNNEHYTIHIPELIARVS